MLKKLIFVTIIGQIICYQANAAEVISMVHLIISCQMIKFIWQVL